MSALAGAPPRAADLEKLERTRARIAAVAGIVVVTLAALVAGALGGTSSFLAVGLVGALALPFIWWRAPASGAITLLACATVIEQSPYIVGIPGLDAFTDNIPLFQSLQGGLGLGGFVMSPVDIAVVILLLVWLTRGVTQRNLRLPHSQVAAMIGVLVLLAVIALIRGLTGGKVSADGISGTTAALWEIRPWIYLGATYLLASQAITTRRATQAVLWTFVLGSGFKSLQGVYIFIATRSEIPHPEAILAHEESVLFGTFVILTLCLWLFGQRGRLRATATALLPFVLIADIGNTRRDAFLVLGAELILLTVLAYAVLPERRQMLRIMSVSALVAFALYLPLEWNSTGTLAGPAQTVRSAISPNPRDALSNQYRVDEDADLGNMIKQDPIFGIGFGVPIAYNYTPVQDIDQADTFIAYLPHNTLLYVWMRMGLPGEVALWMFVAAALLAGTRASRSANREVALIGTLVACTSVGWAIMGYTDMGFWWFRIAIAFGCLLGVLHAAVERDRRSAPAGAGSRLR
jgi:O-antigen ligase